MGYGLIWCVFMVRFIFTCVLFFSLNAFSAEKVEDYSNTKIVGYTYVKSVVQQGEKDLFDICQELSKKYICERFKFNILSEIEDEERGSVFKKALGEKEALGLQFNEANRFGGLNDQSDLKGLEEVLAGNLVISGNNSWNAFQKRMGGRGFSRQQMGILYRAFQPFLIHLEPKNLSERLTVVKFVGCSLEDDVFHRLQDYLRFFKSLKFARFDKNNLSTNVLEDVFSFVSQMTSLRSISIVGNDFFLSQREEVGNGSEKLVLQKIVIFSKKELRQKKAIPVWWRNSHSLFYDTVDDLE